MIALSDDKMTIRLTGVCHLAEAETLQQHLAANRTATVDWSGCISAHTAVIQILLAARPRMTGTPANQFLKAHIVELLEPLRT